MTTDLDMNGSDYRRIYLETEQNRIQHYVCHASNTSEQFLVQRVGINQHDESKVSYTIIGTIDLSPQEEEDQGYKRS